MPSGRAHSVRLVHCTQSVGTSRQHHLSCDPRDESGEDQDPIAALHFGDDVEASVRSDLICEGTGRDELVDCVALATDNEEGKPSDLEDGREDRDAEDVQASPGIQNLYHDQKVTLLPHGQGRRPQDEQERQVEDHHDEGKEEKRDLDEMHPKATLASWVAPWNRQHQSYVRIRPHRGFGPQNISSQPFKAKLEGVKEPRPDDHQRQAQANHRRGTVHCNCTHPPVGFGQCRAQPVSSCGLRNTILALVELANLFGVAVHATYHVSQNQGGDRGQEEEMKTPSGVHVDLELGSVAKFLEELLHLGREAILVKVEGKGDHKEDHDEGVNQRPLTVGVDEVQDFLPLRNFEQPGRQEEARKHREQLEVGPHATEGSNQKCQPVHLCVQHVLHRTDQGELEDGRQINHLLSVRIDGRPDQNAFSSVRGQEGEASHQDE
mmetsp:Transcript_32536/g.87347  ORF Transcript_32536/g.87347 Transcript_32536/m.87347 type:complete len:435 (-) Transcript_32536:1817-3121(-)